MNLVETSYYMNITIPIPLVWSWVHLNNLALANKTSYYGLTKPPIMAYGMVVPFAAINNFIQS